ncbi:TPA: hypothetical protein ACM24T_000436 [Neisseria meningitidis]
MTRGNGGGDKDGTGRRRIPTVFSTGMCRRCGAYPCRRGKSRRQPRPPPGVSDGIAAHKKPYACTRANSVIHTVPPLRVFPNRLQVPPVRRVMPPPFKGNARVNGFAVGREAGVRRVSWGIENITMQKENFSIIRQDSLTDS